MSRPFAYNPSKVPISGTLQSSDLAIGDSDQDYSTEPGSVKWWMGPNETTGYVICAPVPTGDYPTPIGNVGTVHFWRSESLTDNSFLSLVTFLSNGTVTTLGGIQTWLTSQGYWSSWTPVTPLVGYFLSPTGSDTTGDGSIASPWFTLNKAWTVITAGDTVYLRGGTYAFNTQQYLTGKNGTSGNLIKIFAYPSETPVLTKSGSYNQGDGKGIHFVGDYFHWKGIDISGYVQLVSGALATGFRAENSNYNTFELLKVHGNGNGFQMANNGYVLHSTGNLFLNCDFYENQDPYTVGDPYGNADGLSIAWITHPEDTNTVRDCRFWRNTDDGIDLYHNDGTVIIENCQSFYNGYIPQTFTSAGDGNGFKLGDGITDQSTVIKRIVNNCIAISNRTNGFGSNAVLAKIQLYNSTAYNNGWKGIRLSDNNLPSIVKNCVAYNNPDADYDLIAGGDYVTNSYQNGLTVTNADFVSVDHSLLLTARQANGNLPVTNFLKLASGSDLIDAGTDVGITYSGSAPDLGAYELQ